MSLLKCPNCKKKISYWKVYKNINVKKRKYTCKKCHTKLKIKCKTKTFLQRLLWTFLWLGFPAWIIILVVGGVLNPFVAMAIVIAFHFVWLHYIITRYKYKVLKK